MRLTGVGVGLALVLTAAGAAGAQSVPQGRTAGAAAATELGPRDVSLTVHYKGAGPVSEKHQVWVFVFDNPNIGGDSEPLDFRAVTTNGGTVIFRNLAVDTVYFGVVYDEKGDYEALEAPPIGAPVAIFGKEMKAAPVKVGGGATLTFDDTVRWK